jgi:hypothetical protein
LFGLGGIRRAQLKEHVTDGEIETTRKQTSWQTKKVHRSLIIERTFRQNRSHTRFLCKAQNLTFQDNTPESTETIAKCSREQTDDNVNVTEHCLREKIMWGTGQTQKSTNSQAAME